MPLNDLKERQKQLVEVGRIRLGQKVPTSSGRGTRPEKLSTLRFTSPARHLIEEVARQYGGDVKPWQGASGPEFEVITSISEVPVYLARQKIDPWYELWGPGVMQRRCDGVTEAKRNVPCMCGPDREKRLCKPTTRASVMLADIPGFGVWRVESHGINAATAGLGGHIADWIATLPDNVRVPARLKMVPRKEKHLIVKNGTEKVETFEFMVPVLFVDGVTARQIQGGTQSLLAAIGAAEQQALDGRQQQIAAIGAGPVEVEPKRPKLTPGEVVKLAGFVKNVPQLQALWKDAARDEVLTGEVKKVLEARAAELKPTPDVKPVSAPPASAPTAGEPAVEGEVEPDINAVWPQVMVAANALGWNLNQVEKAVQERFNACSDDINGFQAQELLNELKKGALK